MLCLFVTTANAALIRNRTGCTIVVNMFCYDPSTCTATPCSAAIVVPAGGIAALPTCSCSTATLQGYAVCWGAPCANVCVPVSDAAGGPCAFFPTSNILPACPGCNNNTAKIFYNMMGDMVIQ